VLWVGFLLVPGCHKRMGHDWTLITQLWVVLPQELGFKAVLYLPV
jgi:hypothetical protein